jgi:hypothetical protein
MSAERVIASMRRDFSLVLSDGFVDDCLDREVKRLDMASSGVASGPMSAGSAFMLPHFARF